MIRYAQRGIDKTGEFPKEAWDKPVLQYWFACWRCADRCGAGKRGAGVVPAPCRWALCRWVRCRQMWCRHCVCRCCVGAVPASTALALRRQAGCRRCAGGCGSGIALASCRWVRCRRCVGAKPVGVALASSRQARCRRHVGPSRDEGKERHEIHAKSQDGGLCRDGGAGSRCFSGMRPERLDGGDDRRGGRGWPGHRAVPVGRALQGQRGGIPCRHRRRLGHEERRAQRAFQLR